REIEAFFDYYTIDAAIRNIISNALKFTKRGGRVAVSLENLDEQVLVKIVDNGTGMDLKKVNEVLGEAWIASTKGTEHESGSGLGLMLCKTFISNNGGKLQVDSVLGRGTTFFFTLPKNSAE
ncbi:MAG: ATP-binding protein, partial [Magnetococcales bacterium]|nr:ATP-binding protein [Magnetococcales bacterium]